jgi:hypothetical protein
MKPSSTTFPSGLSGVRNTLSATCPISGFTKSSFLLKSYHFDFWSFEYLSIYACLNAYFNAFNFFFFAFLTTNATFSPH